MNLIEALRSGKNLRRPLPKHKENRSGWLANQFVKEYLTCASAWREHFRGNLITEVDLLAEDWELKPEDAR